jgi:lipopolysaccharide export LptBFGC system permease protein LptF
MENYIFEYDDNKLKIKIFFISFILSVIIFFGLIFFNLSNFFFLIFGTIVIPALIIKLNLKKIKKNGIAIMENGKIIFNLNNVKKEIEFKEIDNYFINSHKGSSLSLKLKTGKRFGIVSNIYFSNPIRFTEVCQIFETEYEKYKKVNNIKTTREKSFFEKKWIFPFLVIFTIIIILLVAYVIYKGQNFTVAFFVAISGLFTTWSGYLSVKKKRKN